MSGMPALVNYSPQPGSVELREEPVPEIGDEDVLVRVQAVGVCGSDLHQWRGSASWKVNYPVILGHEFGGYIERAGSRVSGYAEGDRVVSETAAVLDTASPYYRSGTYNLDPNRLGYGYGVNGAMTRLVKVPQRCLHRIPADLPFERAALTEPCCVAYNAVCRNITVHPGDAVMVIGPGPIGLLCVMMARLCGANPIIAVGTEADAHRLDVARKVGATHVMLSSDATLQEQVRALGDGYGLEAVIDAAGVSATLKLALDVVRPGGSISKVGWGPQPLNFNLDQLVQKAVTLQGSYSHNWPIWERVLAMLASGQLDLTHILNAVRPLEEWRDCFERMQSGEVVKAVLTPQA